MKYILLTLLAFLSMQLRATPITNPKDATRKAPNVELAQQLAKYISYPDVLKQTQQAGVVVIQFSVNADTRLAQLKVFSQNERLNNSLLQQLTGRKLVGYGSDPAEVHTVRLRFQP